MSKSKILPLRPLELHSRPLNQRAIAWSSDAELAVAADDSVTIFLPDFPLLDPNHDLTADENEEGDDGYTTNTTHGNNDGSNGQGDENGLSILPLGLRSGVDGGDNNLDDDMMSSGSEDGDGDDILARGLRGEIDDDPDEGADVGFPGGGPVDRRHQFGQLRRQLNVSHPALSPDLNYHIWEAAGRLMPLIPATLPADQRAGASLIAKEDGNEMDSGGSDDDEQDADQDEDTRESKGRGSKSQRQRQRASHKSVADVLPAEVTPHPGAGTSLIGSTGSTMNHVVALEWSPAGLGRNLRPVLAVLTGAGSLAVYGDGAHLPFGSRDKPWKVMGKGAAAQAERDLGSWLALWAVGENFVVPGQEKYGYGEYVKAFAWCREIAPGRALLAYVNDLRELVVICVATCFRTTGDGLDEAVWNVQEVLRMETIGPHEHLDPYDPDFVPSGSSYCVRWSPWMKGDEYWSCLISYMDRNYVGYKKISVNVRDWKTNEMPVITTPPQDWDGQCLHLTTDAFLEFENTIWDVRGTKICRGIIATPMILVPFEVDLGRDEPSPIKTTHSTNECKTTLPNATHTNPITGLIIHPVGLDVTNLFTTPSYTAVRLSATATNRDWWESNLPQQLNSAGHEGPPQWVSQIESKIHTRTTVGKAGRIVGDGDNGGDADDDDSNDGAALDSGSDHDSDSDDGHLGPDDEDDDFDPWADEGPEIYPWRMRIWGLAASPGGGSTAVLATPQVATRPERADWASHRSQVLISSRRRRRGRQTRGQADPPQPDPDAMNIDPELVGGGTTEQQVLVREEDEEEGGLCTMDVEGLSVEARLWEWMYGGGPHVPGITPRPRHGATGQAEGNVQLTSSSPRRAAQLARDAEAQSRRDKITSFFRPLLTAHQLCVVCTDGRTRLSPLPLSPGREDEEEGEEDDEDDGVPRRHVDCECPIGHQFAICGVSGLPIIKAGVSRLCGACRARCMRADVLADRYLEPAGLRAEAEVVRRETVEGVCPRCGGKYLD